MGYSVSIIYRFDRKLLVVQQLEHEKGYYYILK